MKKQPIDTPLTMKYLLLIVSLTLLVGGCKKTTSVDPTAPTANPVGEWTQANGGAGGFNATETFKNFQYTFGVAAANTPVAIGLTSPDINVQFALFDPLGQ